MTSIAPTPTKKYLTRKEATEYLRKLGLPISNSLLAHLATNGGGPEYFRPCKYVVYTVNCLDEWVKNKIELPSNCDNGGPSDD